MVIVDEFHTEKSREFRLVIHRDFPRETVSPMVFVNERNLIEIKGIQCDTFSSIFKIKRKIVLRTYTISRFIFLVWFRSFFPFLHSETDRKNDKASIASLTLSRDDSQPLFSIPRIRSRMTHAIGFRS